MDENDAELILRLCTRAGMLMEDASATAISLRRDPHISEALVELSASVAFAARLLEVALKLERLGKACSYRPGA